MGANGNTCASNGLLCVRYSYSQLHLNCKRKTTSSNFIEQADMLEKCLLF